MLGRPNILFTIVPLPGMYFPCQATAFMKCDVGAVMAVPGLKITVPGK